MSNLDKDHLVYLGLGSNQGNLRANLDRAIELLQKDEGIRAVKASSYWKTSPVGYADQPDFLNAVIMIQTRLTPRQLLDKALSIENAMGRVRTIRWGPRVIDIDILLYDDLRIEEPDLTIPHPRMMERRFALGPLAEIAPDLILPDGRSALEAAESLK